MESVRSHETEVPSREDISADELIVQSVELGTELGTAQRDYLISLFNLKHRDEFEGVTTTEVPAIMRHITELAAVIDKNLKPKTQQRFALFLTADVHGYADESIARLTGLSSIREVADERRRLVRQLWPKPSKSAPTTAVESQTVRLHDVGHRLHRELARARVKDVIIFDEAAPQSVVEILESVALNPVDRDNLMVHFLGDDTALKAPLQSIQIYIGPWSLRLKNYINARNRGRDTRPSPPDSGMRLLAQLLGSQASGVLPRSRAQVWSAVIDGRLEDEMTSAIFERQSEELALALYWLLTPIRAPR